MAATRTSVRKIKEVLRLHGERDLIRIPFDKYPLSAPFDTLRLHTEHTCDSLSGACLFSGNDVWYRSGPGLTARQDQHVSVGLACRTGSALSPQRAGGCVANHRWFETLPRACVLGQ